MVNTAENLPEVLRTGSHDNVDTPDARREMVGQLRIRGWSIRRIAAHFDVHPSTIAHDLNKIRAVWKQNMALSYEQHVAEELAALADIEAQLDAAIESGKLEFIRDRVKIRERKARLLGLDSPVKHEVSIVSIDALDAEINRLESLIGDVDETVDDEILDAEIVDE